MPERLARPLVATGHPTKSNRDAIENGLISAR